MNEVGMKKLKKRTKTFMNHSKGKNNNMKECQRTTIKRRVETMNNDSDELQSKDTCAEDMVKPAKMKCCQAVNSTQTNHEAVDQTMVARGSCHQGDVRFGSNCGKQCVAMCLSAIMRSQTKCMKYWQMNEMENVLNTGNELYGFLQRSSTVNNEYLLVSELPTELNVYENNFSMNYGEPVTGTFNENDSTLEEYNMVSLKKAVEQTIQKHQACFICFHGNTFAVIYHGGIYYVFDSHSRSIHGSQVQEGTSILIHAISWHGVYRYCVNLAQSMNLSDNEQFEITGVNLCIIDNAITCTQEHMKADHTCTGSVTDGCIDWSKHMLGHDVLDMTLEDDDNLQEGSSCTLGSSSDDRNTGGNVDGSLPCKKMNSNDKGDVHTRESLDVEIIGQSQPNVMTFSPLTLEFQKIICNQLGLVKSHLNSCVLSVECAVIGKPNDVKQIKGDGNCFFRAISYALSGSENSHMKLRIATVNHLLKNQSKFQGFLREGFMSLEDYVMTQNMFDSGTWATELEIIAMVDMLHVDICTFEW